TRMAPLLQIEGDSKGYLEVISEIGQAHIMAQNYSKGTQALEEAIQLINEGNISDDVLADYSNQDMVRAICIFDFPPPITALGNANLIKWNLHLRIAP